MTDVRMALVDAGQLGQLFLERLGWMAPSAPPLSVALDGEQVVLTQLAQYRGLGVWFCPSVPSVKHQRAIDRAVAARNTERLIIFADDVRQQWRWPRYGHRRAAANPQLVSHTHVIGEFDPTLTEKLDLITIAPGSTISVPELLGRMRTAFDVESERASVAAARLMGTLYSILEKDKVPEDQASLLLARLLFLMFADDTQVWAKDLFLGLLEGHTADDGADLAEVLTELFTALATPQEARSPETPAHIATFPYVNGGIFHDAMAVATLSGEFRTALLDACGFHWGQISPAVFGSMFQTVKDKKSRRELGEHYTSETDILKTIGPLFLDELLERLEASWDDKGQLTRLHNHLRGLRFLDPACGCGNFLIVAYRELRHLELELLKRRRELDTLDGVSTGKDRAQLVIDATDDLHVRLDHFFGIEIEPWPARIAETAMLLVDHQQNRLMDEELGGAPNPLPISRAPRIHVGNALRTDWAHLVPPSDGVHIFGNPPFIGQYTKTAMQTADVRAVWGPLYNGYLDYVTTWYKKALDYYGASANGRWAFVSTSSISQGEAATPLWRPILRAGWRCRFAHRSFKWQSEAAGKAAVHVSILGFDRGLSGDAVLWEYPEGGKGAPARRTAQAINPFLLALPVVFVESSGASLARLPVLDYGNKPTDGGGLIVEVGQYDAVVADGTAATYIRRFVGARELLHDLPRWCLWLVDATRAEIDGSDLLSERVESVRAMRAASTKEPTRKKAATPHLFDENRQPETNYLAIPAHVSEHRRYFTTAYFGPEVICGNANFMAPDPDGFLLGVLSSTMFITWQKAIGGRLESRIRFSNTFSYNTFPLPTPTPDQRAALCAAAQQILSARANHPDRTLAQLYDPVQMPKDLLEAHAAVDAVVDPLFGLPDDPTLDQRQSVLFDHYVALVGPKARIP